MQLALLCDGRTPTAIAIAIAIALWPSLPFFPSSPSKLGHQMISPDKASASLLLALPFLSSKAVRNLEIENKYMEWARSEASLLLSTHTKTGDHQTLLLGHLHHHFLQLPQTISTNAKYQHRQHYPTTPPQGPSNSICLGPQESALNRSHLLPHPRP